MCSNGARDKEEMTNTKWKCPRCGQSKLPPRYNKCPECQLILDETFIKSDEHKGPGWDMSVDDEAPEYKRGGALA